MSYLQRFSIIENQLPQPIKETFEFEDITPFYEVRLRKLNIIADDIIKRMTSMSIDEALKQEVATFYAFIFHQAYGLHKNKSSYPPTIEKVCVLLHQPIQKDILKLIDRMKKKVERE